MGAKDIAIEGNFNNVRVSKKNQHVWASDLLGHSYNVSKLSVKIAIACGIEEQRELSLIRYLALLHDVGKIKISNSILGKPTFLTHEEKEIIKTHTIHSARFVYSHFKFAEPSERRRYAKIVRSHHENWDGTGYPLGVKEDKIPIESRIISITDVYEAITHPRVYRQSIIDEPFSVLEDYVGTKFDPYIFERLKKTGFNKIFDCR